MTPVVCDASVSVAWYVSEVQSPNARLLPHGPHPLLAPTILLAETANALISRTRRGLTMPVDYPAIVLRELLSGKIAFTNDLVLLDSALSIALRLRHPIYDCFYLALCHRVEAMLATFDKRLIVHAKTLAIPLWEPPPP